MTLIEAEKTENITLIIEKDIEIEKIKYAISILNKFTDEYGWFQAIQDLEKQLKQLENESC